MANDYSYFESAFGRGTGNAMRKAAEERKQREQEAMAGLLGAGGGADQYMRMRSDLHRQGLGQSADILTQGNLAQAEALFGAGESAKQRDFEREMTELGYNFQREMAGLERGWSVEDRDLMMKLAKQKAWMDFGGDIIGAIPGLAGLLMGAG